MGLIVDTGVFIRLEKSPTFLQFSTYADRGDAYISAITASELLVGVHRANSEERRLRRSAYVESVLRDLPVLGFDLETARVHAQLLAALAKSVTLGAHDLLIGATALRHGFPILTTNPEDFRRMPGCLVEAVPIT
jgi:tRNA(fMet)-specific endonuclease VapC